MERRRRRRLGLLGDAYAARLLRRTVREMKRPHGALGDARRRAASEGDRTEHRIQQRSGARKPVRQLFNASVASLLAVRENVLVRDDGLRAS